MADPDERVRRFAPIVDPPPTVTLYVDELLRENVLFIKAITENQNIGRFDAAVAYMKRLHENLCRLADLADLQTPFNAGNYPERVRADAPVSNMRRSDRLHDTVEMFDLIHQLSPMSHSTSEAIRYGRWNHAEKRNFRAAVAEKNGEFETDADFEWLASRVGTRTKRQVKNELSRIRKSEGALQELLAGGTAPSTSAASAPAGERSGAATRASTARGNRAPPVAVASGGRLVTDDFERDDLAPDVRDLSGALDDPASLMTRDAMRHEPAGVEDFFDFSSALKRLHENPHVKLPERSGGVDNTSTVDDATPRLPADYAPFQIAAPVAGDQPPSSALSGDEADELAAPTHRSSGRGAGGRGRRHGERRGQIARTGGGGAGAGAGSPT